jgi:hypothetical protein
MRWTHRAVRFRGSRRRLRGIHLRGHWSREMWILLVWAVLLLLFGLYAFNP